MDPRTVPLCVPREDRELVTNARCIADVDDQGELLGADLSSTVSDRADDDMDLFAAINPLLVADRK